MFRLKNIVLLVWFLNLYLFISFSQAEIVEKPQTGTDSIVQNSILTMPAPKQKPAINQVHGHERTLQNGVVADKLNAIIVNIEALKNERKNKAKLLAQVDAENERKTIQSEIDEIDLSIQDQENVFALIQTGGFGLSKIEDSQDNVFDWQKNLLEILQPIMNELHEYTEDKREALRLRNKITFYETQIEDSHRALEQMSRINQAALDKTALNKFMQIKKKWENLLTDCLYQEDIAKIQLQGLLSAKNDDAMSIGDHIKQFVLGRGATILMALLASLFVFFSMLFLWNKALSISTRKQGGKLSYSHRLANLIYRVVTVLFSIATVFYVLNLRNDDVLIAITVLVLVITIWALKNSVPRYINELQTLLDAGPVRDGERILYHGVPMKIERLNFFSRLINPAIPGLNVRMPLSELNNYISRPYNYGEPWFPCQVGDFVLFSDGSCLKVKYISLEYVQLTLGNETMPHMYPIQDFIDACPKNLSSGFIVVSIVGIDYQHQPQSTTDVPKIFQDGIQEKLRQESYGKALLSLSVYFEQANTSSLDYKIIASFEGGAASDYYAITRDLQRFAVDVCNQQQWTIPFSQIVVHQE